jgi:hypothetical protein
LLFVKIGEFRNLTVLRVIRLCFRSCEDVGDEKRTGAEIDYLIERMAFYNIVVCY